MAIQNKRAHPRVPIYSPVHISKPMPMEGTGINLGAGGVALHVPVSVSEGSMVEVDFLATGAPVSGTVRRTMPHADGGFLLGIEWHVTNRQLVSRMA